MKILLTQSIVLNKSYWLDTYFQRHHGYWLTVNFHPKLFNLDSILSPLRWIERTFIKNFPDPLLVPKVNIESSRSTSSPSLHNILPYVRSIHMNKYKSAGNRSIFLTFVAAHLSKMCQFNNVVVYIYFHLQWRQRNSHFPIWCQKLHQRGRLFEVSIQLRRRR